MQKQNQASPELSSWLDRPLASVFRLNWETLIFLLILVAAILTRFYDLEARVMSHDENSHVYFSWLLSRGQGYAHDPVTHGPFQFHLVALTYFLFGDNDFTARIPAALFSIATVGFMWFFRRYLGRVGALAAAFMLLISPYILYYGRYVRNEAFVGLWGVMILWAILRYLETGQRRFLYWLTAATVLHFCTKETSYIYHAQALLFLGLYFIYRITLKAWSKPLERDRFLISLILALALLTTGLAVRSTLAQQAEAAQSAQALDQATGIPELTEENAPPPGSSALPLVLIAVGVVALGGAAYFLISGYGWENLRQERSFDLLILLGTLVLPHLSPFLIDFVGWHVPVNASEVRALTTTQIFQMAAILAPMALLSLGIGLWWNARLWLVNNAIFYGVFTVLFTTFFTNGAGFFTGMLGSLGYWFAQQAVERGSQPLYYYALLQIPMYEFLPALGCLLAIVLGIWQSLRRNGLQSPIPPADTDPSPEEAGSYQPAPTYALLGFWAVTSLAAYSIAGEKMPWLTFHIALPMILWSAWAIGVLFESTDWDFLRRQRGWVAALLIPVFLTSASAALAMLLSDTPPFQGASLEQLSATSTFVVSLGTALAVGAGLIYLFKDWSAGQVARLLTFGFLALLALLTIRASFRAAYVTYDQASEFLVYAHSGPGVKIALQQIEEISRRTTGGLEVVIAYDDETTYPYWWYLRNYTNTRFFGADPTRDLREAPLILVGDKNYGKIEPVVGQAYYSFDYIRIWWPNQDYYDLTWERLRNAFTDPQMRSALFKIWLSRDYSDYGRLTNKDMSLQHWSPSSSMRLYIRKDIVAKLWDFGSSPVAGEIVADPYEGKEISLTADRLIGAQGSAPGQLLNPRGVAVAPDGSVYVADTSNHRIQHFNLEGGLISSWGSFADIAKGPAPGGTFYEPWSVAVAEDGSVFVADTWNHRIQKFSADGQFIKMWGFFGQAELPEAFWGPRSVVVSPQGQVFVADTGNKRVVVFDLEGNFITEAGLLGMLPGEFDEPVGLALDLEGVLYVADTWNQRIQALVSDAMGKYLPLRAWDMVAWYGQSWDNKPYLAVGPEGHVYASDPEGHRIIEFTSTGDVVRYWGQLGAGLERMNLPAGLAYDGQGGLWVADSGNHRVLHFALP